MSSDNVYQKYAYLTVNDITDGLFENTKSSKIIMKDDNQAVISIDK